MIEGPSYHSSLSARDHIIATTTTSLKNCEVMLASLLEWKRDAEKLIKEQQSTIALQGMELEGARKQLHEAKAAADGIMTAINDKYVCVKVHPV